MLFFTDGLSDERKVQDEEFGLEGIQELCARHIGESPLDLLGHLFSAIQRFTANCKQWNDMTAADIAAAATVANWVISRLFSIDLPLLFQ